MQVVTLFSAPLYTLLGDLLHGRTSRTGSNTVSTAAPLATARGSHLGPLRAALPPGAAELDDDRRNGERVPGGVLAGPAVASRSGGNGGDVPGDV